MSRWFLCTILIAGLVAGLGGSAGAEQEIGRGWHTLLDQSGRVLLRTGHQLTPGDLFVAMDNREYIVNRTAGTFAYARATGRSVGAAMESRLPVGDNGQGTVVAIYHSHGDESYVPTDGESSIPGQGGIIKVGERLSDELEARGLETHHSDEAHHPHDAGAYDRSRSTAMELMEQQPAVIFDVHRDTGPPGMYEAEVDGERTAQILLVVGRQNPSVQTNAEFARELKRAADERYPGLIRGILFARGKYNQDLHPRAVLLEVGSHVTSREDAERAVTFIADVVPEALGTPATVGQEGPAARSGVITGLVLLVSAALIGGSYLIVATGSIDEARQKLRQFVRRDLGLRGKDGQGED